MKRISSIILLLLIQASSLFAQEYTVKWGPTVEGFERILRIDDDGVYCFFSEPGKKKKITPFFVKYDNDFNRVLSIEISTSEQDVYLNNFFALKENFVFVTRIDDEELSTYYAALINKKGDISEAKQVFQTRKVYNTVSDGIESSSLYVYPSEDSTHILMYYNPAAIDYMYNQKALNANEEIQFAVYTQNLELVYNRTINLENSEQKLRNYSFLLASDNKLITYSTLSPKGNFEIYWTEKRGRLYSDLQYIIGIYGAFPHEDNQLILPTDQYIFYESSNLKSLSNGKVYLASLCTNFKYNNIQAVMICEINSSTKKINPVYYSFSHDLINTVNNTNEDKTDKKEPAIKPHVIKGVYVDSQDKFKITLERYFQYTLQSALYLELRDGKILSCQPLPKPQRAHGIATTNDIFSFKDFMYKDNLYLIYNEHADNLSATKNNRFFQNNTSDFNIVISSFDDSSYKKNSVSKNANNGYQLLPRYSKFNNNKMVMVSWKDKKYKLGLLEIK